MPHRILVVDDEDSFRALLGSYLRRKGYLVVEARDGAEAIAALDAERPHLALVDFLLPKKNGFAVAEAIRGHAHLRRMPIILMSGVFKNPRTVAEAKDRYRVHAFLSKPFDLQELSPMLEAALASVPPDAQPTAEGPVDPEAAELIADLDAGGRPDSWQSMFPWRPTGSLREVPLGVLLTQLGHGTTTGMLDIRHQGTHRRIYVQGGAPVFMQSNAQGENVGHLLRRRGRLADVDYRRAVEHMKANGTTLQQALLSLRLASESELARAYVLLAGELLPHAIGMADGAYSFQETDAFVGRVPTGHFDLPRVIMEGVRDHVHPPQALEFFSGRERRRLVRTPRFDALWSVFEDVFGASSLRDAVDGVADHFTLLKDASDYSGVALRLYAMCVAGMIHPGGIMVAADEDEVPEEEPTSPGEAQKIRDRIEAFHQKLSDRDHFALFGVERDTSVDRIKQAYFELAREWHEDRFAAVQLEAATRTKVKTIFQRITEAYETLTDPVRRQEYLVYLERRDRGLSTNVNEVLHAEQLFDRAQLLLKRRAWAEAANVIEQALRLNPGEPLYEASLAWARFHLDKRSRDNVVSCVRALKKATRSQENLPVAYHYLAQIFFAREKFDEAKKWWKMCLEWDPDHVDAQRGLRMIRTRTDGRRSRSGLLGMFGRK